MIRVHSLVQPAVVVDDLDAASDRVFELFRAAPSERNDSETFRNAVYAFGNDTYLELLDGMHEGHTRMKFLRNFGPGLYMLCVDVGNDDPEEVASDLDRLGIRVVAPGRETVNIVRGWHLHPRDAGGILVLLALKKDKTDNRDWAGHQAAAYVASNTRVVDALGGVLARTTGPRGESKRFGDLGFGMEPIAEADGALGWRGPTGTLLELWPANAWQGDDVSDRRDYALCFTSKDQQASVRHLEACGLRPAEGSHGGRWLSTVDPVLGVRIAVEAAG